MSDAFYNFSPYRRWLDAARTRRVDAALIGDSNTFWISHPGYAEEAEWPALVRDVAAESRVRLWWNPKELVGADYDRQRAIAAEVFGGLTK